MTNEMPVPVSTQAFGQHPSPRWVRLARTAVPVTVVIASAVFLVDAFYNSWGELRNTALDGRVYLTVLGLSVAYGCAYFLLVAAWHFVLQRTSAAQPPFRTSAYIYCLANMAKYLPGSIFHLAGRQILGARAGWKQGAIARATLLELGANVAAVGGIIVVTIALEPDLVADHLVRESWWLPVSAPQVLLVGALGAAIVTALILGRSKRLFRFLGITWATLSVVLALNVAFFLSNFAMALVLAAQIADTPTIPLHVIGIAYLIAWLAGFVIPGAPGGIGVREGVLVLLLAGHPGGEAAGLALGIGMRAVTTFGDVLSGAVGYWIGRGALAANRS